MSNEVSIFTITESVNTIPGLVKCHPYSLAINSGTTRICVNYSIVPESQLSHIKPEPCISLTSADSMHLKLISIFC